MKKSRSYVLGVRAYITVMNDGDIRALLIKQRPAKFDRPLLVSG